MPSLPSAPRGSAGQRAPLAVPGAGEAQLDVLSGRRRVEEAAAFIPLGDAGRDEEPG